MAPITFGGIPSYFNGTAILFEKVFHYKEPGVIIKFYKCPVQQLLEYSNLVGDPTTYVTDQKHILKVFRDVLKYRFQITTT